MTAAANKLLNQWLGCFWRADITMNSSHFLSQICSVRRQQRKYAVSIGYAYSLWQVIWQWTLFLDSEPEAYVATAQAACPWQVLKEMLHCQIRRRAYLRCSWVPHRRHRLHSISFRFCQGWRPFTLLICLSKNFQWVQIRHRNIFHKVRICALYKILWHLW